VKTPAIVKAIQNKPLAEVNYAFHKSISYSQFSTYTGCPRKWQLQYREGLDTYQSTINTVFGTAIHETLQHYLTTMYETSVVEADKINLEDYFEDRFRTVYMDEYNKNNKVHFSDAVEMREFYDDGVAILNYFKKKRGQYFNKKNWHLIKCELPLITIPDEKVPNVYYKGYLDLVLYNENTKTFKIIDIKTSTRGWNNDTKKDELKQFQLILYKYFFSKIHNIPEDEIEVEFFIVKRKIWEKSEYPQSRVQEFAPPSGKIKVKKALSAFNNFIEQCFNSDGTYKNTEHPFTPNKNCQYCPFHNKKDLCPK
jgi:hypothetical protein